MRGTRKDQSALSVTIDGEDTGIWEKKTGGGMGSDNSLIYPGGRARPVSIGGKQIPGAVTLVRTVDLDRDWPKIKLWQNKCGKQKPVIVKDQALDADDNVFGSPFTQVGTLTACNEPERDSEDSGAAQVTIEVAVEGAPA
jgi:hypothetical protein